MLSVLLHLYIRYTLCCLSYYTYILATRYAICLITLKYKIHAILSVLLHLHIRYTLCCLSCYIYI